MGKSSKSYNQAYGSLNSSLSPMINTGVNANQMIANALGIGTDPNAASQAYDTFKGSTGFDKTLSTAMSGINQNAAAKGMLNSGATGQALLTKANDLGNQNFMQWLQSLTGVANNGMQAGNTIAGAGNISKSSDNSGYVSGIGSLLGSGGVSGLWGLAK